MPSQLVLLVDTREARPLSFGKRASVKRETLPFGDYGAEIGGQRVPIVLERKSLPDLWGTLSKGHDRFRRELISAHDAGIQMLLGIEGTLSKVLDGIPYSDITGEQMVQTVMTLWMKYGLRPVFCDGRRELATFIMGLFEAVERTWAR